MTRQWSRQLARRKRKQAGRPRRRGVAAILAMIFLVIFSSLAAAMAVIAQGNLTTADTHLKINRSLSAAETGLAIVEHRLEQISATVFTRKGEIDADLASQLWYDSANEAGSVRTKLLESFAYDLHNIEEPKLVGDSIEIGPIAVAPGGPTFRAWITPHPLVDEDYDSDFYQQPPYSEMDPVVSSTHPLDANWLRVVVVGEDGPAGHAVHRAVQMDFKIGKRIRFALLSKSRVMIGRNVMIEGPIGSKFTETNLENGHPIQMASDFRGLDPDLDDDLNVLQNTLYYNDTNFDNRINLQNTSETEGIANPENFDTNDDGYIDEYDFFLAHYDANGDGAITSIELDTAGDLNREQLFTLIDTMGDPSRPGYNDGVIDDLDDYTKVRGEIHVKSNFIDWYSGAAHNNIQDYFQGPIRPDYQSHPLTFESEAASATDFTPQDFDVATFRNLASGSLANQTTENLTHYDADDPNSPQPISEVSNEEVPFGAAHPYDYYDRPVYRNMTFENVTIPKGTNALFVNCTFIGVTFVETETNNTHPMYNYAGMQEAGGDLKHPDKMAEVGETVVDNTKTISNNLRFHGCTFEGAIVSDAPQEFTHARNKVAFTGKTNFAVDESTHLTSSEKKLFKRSTILMPHYSVEMGTFIAPYDNNEDVKLSGTIVAGVLDMRGKVTVDGSVVTTFEPKSNEGPVLGETSPQFNTTLGYFPSSQGDLESELPTNGVGIIRVRYNPNIPLPDGINGAIEYVADHATYAEVRVKEAWK